MFYIIVIISLLLNSMLYAESKYQWNIERVSNSNDLSIDRISALDSNSYVRSFSTSNNNKYRALLWTFNKGKTWDTLYASTIEESFDYKRHFIYDVTFLDKDNIIALCGNQQILQTTNGGQSWIDTSYFDSTVHFSNIYSKDSIIMLGGVNNQFVISKDMGRTWELKSVDIVTDSNYTYDNTFTLTPVMYQDTLYTIKYLQTKVPFISNLNYFTDCLFLFSTDLGESWESLFFVNEYELSPVFSVDEQFIWGQAGYNIFDTTIVKDPDGNIDTAHFATGYYEIIKIDKFSGEKTILSDSTSYYWPAIRSMDKFANTLCLSTITSSYISTDFGISWEEEAFYSSSGKTHFFSGIDRVSVSQGMMVGPGYIATLEPATSVSEHNPLTSEIAVYPNPAGKDDEITIDFEAHEAGKYTLQLTALDGSECNIKQTETLSAGLNRVSLNLSTELASGIYILTIYKEGLFVAAQKVVISE